MRRLTSSSSATGWGSGGLRHRRSPKPNVPTSETDRYYALRLCVSDAERHGMHSHAERGNDHPLQSGLSDNPRICASVWLKCRPFHRHRRNRREQRTRSHFRPADGPGA
ncbi:hypothetical protein EMIT0P2_20060 [Pseudomonas sp. IT-P2]